MAAAMASGNDTQEGTARVVWGRSRHRCALKGMLCVGVPQLGGHGERSRKRRAPAQFPDPRLQGVAVRIWHESERQQGWQR